MAAIFQPCFKHFFAKTKRVFNFMGISVSQIKTFKIFGLKLKLPKAENEFKQPNTANWPNLEALQPNRAELD